MNKTLIHTAARLACAACLAAALPALAQGNNAPNREREALRRAQAALQQANGERDSLAAAKAALEKDKTASAALAEAARKQAGSAQAEVAKLREALAQRQTETEAERAREAEARRALETAAEQREQALRQQLAQAQRTGEERAQANAALVAMLAERTTALADARQRVQQLHTLGLEAVERFRTKGLTDQALQADPLLGLTAVRLENAAEDLRTRLDAQRLVHTP